MESLFNAARRWMWPAETALPPDTHPPVVFDVSLKLPMRIELLVPEDMDFNEILDSGTLNMCSGEFPGFHFPPHCHPTGIEFMPNMDF